MTTFRTVYRLLLFLLLTASPLVAPSRVEAHSQPIRVVMDNNFPPFVFQDSTGKLQGILIDQWRLWEQKTGIKVEIHAMDWGKAVAGMKGGEYDVIDTIFKTEKRYDWFDFTKPYTKIELPIFFDKEISGITDAASLKEFVVAVKSGDATIDILKRNGVDNLLLFSSYEAIILAAKEHKVTVFVMGKPSANYFLNKYGILHHFKQSAPLYVGLFHRAVSKGNGQLLKLVEEGFGRITPNERKKIEGKWYGSSLGDSLPVDSILAGIGVMCLLLLVLFVWNRTLKRAVEKRTAELKRTEDSLRLTSFAVEHAADSVLWITADASIIVANEAACRLLGYTRDELLKLKIVDIDTNYNANVWPRHWEELKAHGSLFFETGQHAKDGRIIPVEITANFIRFNDSEYNCAFVRDITDRKRAEDTLREREERLRVIFEASDSGIILVSSQGTINFANRRMAELFGMQLPELLGTFYSEHLHESEKKVGDERMCMFISGEIQSVANERRFIRKDGTDFWGYLSGRRLENPDGSLRALVGVISDITDRKKAEGDRLNLERQLLHAQKLESLGILSGGIAHDFNNLLQAVLGNLDLALVRLPQETSARNNIDQAIKAARHAAKLTNMMLAYSGKGLFVIKPLNLTELVEENATMLDAAIPKSITLEQHLDHALPIIKADAGQLQQVIMNLITNASESIGDASGTITLATGVGEIDQSILNESRLDEKTAAGSYVWMEVRDNGCGMDGETLHKLFDPFFTTKFTGRGLGMSAVQGIIRAHKGAFLVKSVLGGGTTIKVLFPVGDDQTAGFDLVGAGESVQEEQVGRSVNVLVVDDEDMILDVSTAMLKELGFETLAASSGEEALALFREVGDSIGVVLLDQVMPGMDGVSVFKELRNIRPDIKVLLASGFSKQEVSERFRGLGLNGFLPKPYSLKNLTAELSRVLKKTDE